MSVKVTTEVAEVEASKAPPDAQGQVLVNTANLTDRASGSGKRNEKSVTKSFAATLGFGKRDKAKPLAPASTSASASTKAKATKTRRRSAVLGAGLMETTTTVMKRATLQEVGASTEEGGKRGHGGGRGDSSGVMQVELSVKHAFGIPVARDSRMGDIRQRGMRACLFYDTGSEVDKDTGETSSEYGEHFLCNTYKTLAIQHPQKEEQWLFPDSAEGERKFLVRTDFGSGGGGSKSRQARRRGSSRNRNHNQGTGDDSPPPSSSFRGDRNRLFLLVELTCTVQTAKDGAAAGMDSYDDGLAGGGRRGRGGGRGEGAVRGPLKNFRVSGGSSGRGDRKGTRRGGRVGGVRGKGGGDDGDGSDSYANSGEGSSADDYDSQRSDEEDSETASASSRDSGGRSGKSRGGTRRRRGGNLEKGRNRGGGKNTSKERRNRGRRRHDDDDSSSSANGESDGGSGSGSSSNSSGNNNGNKKRRGSRGLFSRNGKRKSGKTSIRKKNPRSAPPPRGGRHTGPGPRDRRGVRSEDPGGKRRRRGRNNGSESDDYNGSHSGESEYSSASNSKRGRRGNKGGGGKGVRAERRRGRDGDGGKPSWGRKNSGRTEAMGGAGVEGGGVVEVEMSCGWVLIPFLELVEAHEVKKVRYKLLGGTPFAKMDIDEDEVMTRRYGWRAVLKAMKIEGMHKGSEVEIKILPVNALAKLKQEDIFRLPRNVILSDTFVSLVRHYREYAANSLAKRSARGMGNVGFGAGSASSEPVLALFPRLAADPALMMALKNQWEAEVRKTHIDGRLGATISSKLVGLGLGGGGGGDGSGGGGLVGVTGAAREACLLAAFEKAVMRMWPAFCHIDAQRGRVSSGEDGAESYEELESRGQRIRQILDSTDSFNSDTPTKAVHGEDGGGGWRGGDRGHFPSAVSQEGRVMVAFTLKEVAFDVA